MSISFYYSERIPHHYIIFLSDKGAVRPESAVRVTVCVRRYPGNSSDILTAAVHTGLRICCTNGEKVTQECKNPISRGGFKWIFVCCRPRNEQ